MRVLRKFGYGNILLAGVILLLWVTAAVIHGLPGTYAWTALKLAVPFAGLLGLLYHLLTMALRAAKKKPLGRKLISLLLCAVWSSHLLLTMNVVKLAYPVTTAQAGPGVTVSWPFAKAAVVGWGGDSVNDNLPHAIWASERWAYDLVMEPYGTGTNRPEDYGVWDQEVLSPADGVVIRAYDGEADLRPGDEESATMEGNHVYIRLEPEGTYLLLNHFKQGSLQVKTGDRVKTGDVLGRVGNSGSTSEPHLHIHHQRQNPLKTPYPVLAEGLPLYFKGTDGGAMPVKGTVVTPNTAN